MLTSKRIAQKALPTLMDNLVMPALANVDYSDTFAKEGDTIQVKRPAVYVADEFSGTINLQNINPFPVLLKMDTIADVSVEVTALELALELDDFAEDVLNPALISIAEQVNSAGLGLYVYVPHFEGTAGSTPDALADIANVRKSLNISKAPMGNRSGVWDPDADAALSIVDAIVNAEKSGSTAALREGSIGKVQGINNFMSQAVKTHTAGLYSALADVKAAYTLDATDVVDSTTGLTYSNVVLTSTAGSSTAVLKQGDLLTISGVQYTVFADTVAAISGVVTVSLFSKVAATLAAADVVFADVTAGSHVANLGFNKSAFGFVTRPQSPLAGADSSTASFGGLSVRVSIQGSITSKKTIMSIDLLYGWAPLYPELAVVTLG
jgi:hypothetical protein